MFLASRLGWPLLATVAPVAIAAAIAGTDATLAWRDTARILAPVRPLVVEALRHGRLPLWNPFVGTGAPLLGDAIHGVLHPVSLVAALLGDGVDVLLYLYLATASLGAYVAARTFGASRAASAAAAIGYGASGAVYSTISLVQCLAGAATFPWIVAAARHLGRSGPHGVTALALAVAAMLVGGDVQGAVLGSAAGLVIACEAGGARAAARWAGALALGATLASVQLVPTWNVMQRSLRVHQLDATTLHQWALHPWRILELLVPGLVGGDPGYLRAAAFLAVDPGGTSTLTFLQSVAVGVPLLVAASAGTRTRAGRMLAVGAVLLLWLALGHWLGAQQALSWMPVWNSFRYAEKILPFLTLVLALLAALGADRISEASGRLRTPVAALIGLAGAVSLGVEVFLRTVPRRASLPDEALRIASGATSGFLMFAAGVMAVGAWLLLARRRPALAGASFVAVVLLSSACASGRALLAMPRDSLRRPPALQADPPGPRVMMPRPALLETPDVAMALSRIQAVESEGAAADYNVAARLDSIDVLGALPSARFELLWREFGEDRWKLFRRFGVTHVAIPVHLVPQALPVARMSVEGGALQVDSGAVRFYAVPHRPWAFFATAARAIPSQLQTLGATRKAAVDGAAEVILEASAVPSLAPGRVLRIGRSTEEVVIEAEAQGDGLLVVNDAFAPGWIAEIDGEPAPILPADVLVRAVPFPAGRHRLVMRYEPPAVRLGIALSAAGIAWCVVGGALARWRRMRARGGVTS